MDHHHLPPSLAWVFYLLMCFNLVSLFLLYNSFTVKRQFQTTVILKFYSPKHIYRLFFNSFEVKFYLAGRRLTKLTHLRLTMKQGEESQIGKVRNERTDIDHY